MFAAVFNATGRPVDCRRVLGAACGAGNPAGDRHVALVWSRPGPEADDGEWRGTASLGERYWVVGRIRLDDRLALHARLAGRLRPGDGVPSDGILCLHAYDAWGEGFADHLRGDFCFALWDRQRQCLIALRDQLGVRSLFHAEAAGSWFVSDSLDWIVAAAAVGDALDDHWIADFLGVGFSLDVERTAYRDVRRLAPAHMLSVSRAGVANRRYWRLEIDEPLYYRDRRQYGEQFRELLSRAIVDRLPAGQVGISMSGGLDSTTLAACAVDVLGDSSRVVAECTHFERLMPDDEKHFASLAAHHLGIDLTLRACDDLAYDPDWRNASMPTSEPAIAALSARFDRRIAIEQADRARVWFFGEGPDNALEFEPGAYLSWLIAGRRWRRLGEAGFQHLGAKGLEGWTDTLKRCMAGADAEEEPAEVPPWIQASLVDRVDLRERVAAVGVEPADRHPWHPRAVASFSDPIWCSFFEEFARTEATAPIVWRHPYLDLRVLGFMLSVPTVPWARGKLLLREAMRGRLPAAVLGRKKTPLARSALAETVRLSALADGALGRYVDVRCLPETASGVSLDRLVAVHALDHWLTGRHDRLQPLHSQRVELHYA